MKNMKKKLIIMLSTCLVASTAGAMGMLSASADTGWQRTPAPGGTWAVPEPPGADCHWWSHRHGTGHPEGLLRNQNGIGSAPHI